MMSAKWVFALFFILVFSGLNSKASSSELAVRAGYFSANYSGALENKFSSTAVLDLEYSQFISSTSALVFRTTNVAEFPTVVPLYQFSGAGLRFFTEGPAYAMQTQEQGFSYTAVPKWRRYFGFEIGFAQATVISYGKVLQTTSSMIVANLNAGAIYTLTPQMGLSAQANLGIGSGYSSISVLSHNFMGLLGLSFFF